MKRDMELIRKLASRIEACDALSPEKPKPSLEEYSRDQIDHHVWLMLKAGLIEAEESTNEFGTPIAIAKCLTWSGHDFVDAAKNDTLWKRAMAKAAAVGGGIGLDVIVNYVKSEAAKLFNQGQQ